MESALNLERFQIVNRKERELRHENLRQVEDLQFGKFQNPLQHWDLEILEKMGKEVRP